MKVNKRNFSSYSQYEFEKKTLLVLGLAGIFWLIVCQVIFIFIQENQAVGTQKIILNQFREESTASNFLYLSRAVSDLDQNGTISCAILYRIDNNLARKKILDLSFPEECANSIMKINLSGSFVQQDVKAINGDDYSIEYRSVNSPIFYLALWILRISGLVVAFFAVLFYESQTRRMSVMLQAEKLVSGAKIAIAKQVAHDIRSPLSAIQLALSRLNESQDEEYLIIRAAISRVNQIANDLLLNSQKDEKYFFNEALQATDSKSESASNGSLVDIVEATRQIIEEKQFILQNLSKKINLKLDVESGIQIFTRFDENIWKRVLSNIINNSIEAIVKDEGSILVSLRDYKSEIHISISDDGAGIPSNILEKIGNQGMSFGKEKDINSGSGLGVYSAKKSIEDSGGKFRIHSKVDLGTLVEILLKKEQY